MLSFLRCPSPLRKKQSHRTTITTEHGRTRVTFFETQASAAFPPPMTYSSGGNIADSLDATQAAKVKSASRTVMRSHIPPGNTIHKPPYHFHTSQSETFKVISGAMLATVEGRSCLISSLDANPYITIEQGQYHTFINHSSTNGLVVEVALDPPRLDHPVHGALPPEAHPSSAYTNLDEQFFRNWYCYFDDCYNAGVRPSLFQLMLWLWVFDCYLVMPGPWPHCSRIIRDSLSKLGTWILGVLIGKWTLGYRDNYQEYYDPDHRNNWGAV